MSAVHGAYTTATSDGTVFQHDTSQNNRRGKTHIYISQGAVELLKNDGKHTCTDRQGQAESCTMATSATDTDTGTDRDTVTDRLKETHTRTAYSKG